MKSLENIKLVAFDFDDTLFAHRAHYPDTPSDHIQYLVACLRSSKKLIPRGSLWGSCSTNSAFEEFMEYCETQDIIMGLISWTAASVCATEKINFVKEKYHHTIENWCVGSIDEKIQMLKVLAEVYRLENDQILIIDDSVHVLANANAEGFQAASPIEFVNYWNNFKKE